MATFNWSALVNGQTIASFDPDIDVFNFDDPLISGADVVVNGDTETIPPFSTLSYGGKTVTINVNPLSLTATGSASHVNITFANGSLLLIGDNTTGTANDDAVITLTGGGGNDQIIGLSGADSLVGGGGNDLFTMYSGGSDSWDNDTIRGGSGNDAINFNTGDTAASGLIVLYSGFDASLGALATITGGDGTPGSTIVMSGVERVTATDRGDTFTGTTAIPINGLRTDVTLVFDGAGGNDTINGAAGDGINTVISYRTAASGVTVNLATNTTANDGLGGSDSFTNIDGVFGSNFADLITGGSNSKSASGGTFEFYEGYAGNDTINGGSGADRVQYVNSPGAVSVNLSTGIASDGWSSTDTLIAIEQVRGSSFADTLTGDAEDNRLSGDGGNDTLNGGDGFDEAVYQFATNAVSVNLATGIATDIGGTSNGTDTLIGIESARGTDFNDSLVGGGAGLVEDGAGDYAGAELFEGRAGNDTIDGGDTVVGAGSLDVVSYVTAPSAVVVNLSSGTVGAVASNTANDGYGVNGNPAGIDTLININGIEGSRFNDTLVGGNNSEFFFGLNGADSIVGGGGIDTLDYADSPNRVIVNMFTSSSVTVGADTVVAGTALDGYGTTDTISEIENVIGTDFNDYLQGVSNVANTLAGEGGNDTLIGSGVSDSIPGAMDDTLLGGAGNDTLRQTRGHDSIDGGADFDALEFTSSGITYGTGAGQSSVSVNLAAGTSDADANDADTVSGAGGDVATLSSIETVIGTAGNDVFVGGDAAHNPDSSGTGISETFRGNGGNDSITGGTANGLSTIADYSNNTNVQAVSANLFTGIVSDGLGGTDTLVNVDQLRGGAGNDSLVGGGLSRTSSGNFQEIFRGNSGNDTLDSGSSLQVGNDQGLDRADYANNTSGQAINVNLATGIVLDGRGGTDTLIDINSLYGGAGNDTFLGSAGNDTFDGGAGNDTLDGAGGTDEARFSQSTAGVIVNLSAGSILVNSVTVQAGTAYDGMGGTDALINMEGAQGSGFNDYIRGSDDVNTRQFFAGVTGSDTIDGGAGIDFANYSAVALALGGLDAFIENGSGTVNDKMGGTDTLINIEGLGGTNSNDTLTGGLGDQWFRGHGGSDSINGGAGNDWVLYSNSPSGVTIDLGTGTATDGYNGLGGLLALGGTDTLVSIENAEASDNNDTVTGSSTANELRGRAGDDAIAGGAGNDTLIGGSGDDALDGGSGLDAALYAGLIYKQHLVTGNPAASGSIDGPQGLDTLTSIEALQFVDGSMNFDPYSHVAQVHRLYEATLNRAGDVLGLNYHTGLLDSGWTLSQDASSFVGSPEFQGNYGSLSNTQFVELVYQNVLHRAADSGGLAYWTGLMSSGWTKGDVVVSFSESAENVGNHASQYAAGLWDIDEMAGSVARLYWGTLDRAPDAGGLIYWTGLVKGGHAIQEAANNFVGSPEFQGNYGSLNNSDFVNQLYLNVLERAADSGGLTYWTGLLTGGATRGDVTLGFTESMEFQVNMIGQINNGITTLDGNYVA